MRTMRWAAELAVSGDAGHSVLGVAQLTALYDSPLLDEELLPQVDAALSAVVSTPAGRIDQIEEDGGTVEVVQAAGPAEVPLLADEPGSDLSWEQRETQAGEGTDGQG
jgi:hypothetical protein